MSGHSSRYTSEPHRSKYGDEAAFNQEAYYMKLYNSQSKGKSGLGMRRGNQHEEHRKTQDTSSPFGESRTVHFVSPMNSRGDSSRSKGDSKRRFSSTSPSTTREMHRERRKRRHRSPSEHSSSPSYRQSRRDAKANSDVDSEATGDTLRQKKRSIAALKSKIRKVPKDSNEGSDMNPLPRSHSNLLELKKVIETEEADLDHRNVIERNRAAEEYDKMRKYIDEEDQYSLSAVLTAKRSKADGLEDDDDGNLLGIERMEVEREVDHLDAIFGGKSKFVGQVKHIVDGSDKQNMSSALLADVEVAADTGVPAWKQRALRKT